MTGRIRSVYVKSLLDMFNYEIEFDSEYDLRVLIAPNGFGKTVLLRLIYSSLNLEFGELREIVFSSIDIHFDDGSHWRFESVPNPEPSILDDLSGMTVRFTQPSHNIVAKLYDERGIEFFEDCIRKLKKLPKGLAVGELERRTSNWTIQHRMFSRTEFTVKRRHVVDFDPNETEWEDEDIEKSLMRRLLDESFRQSLKKIVPSMREIEPVKCIFIETQRLLYRTEEKRIKQGEDDSQETIEESVNTQNDSLRNLLQKRHSDYASISQRLDRSFPSRLISRAAQSTVTNLDDLVASLDNIESYRQELSRAGILLEGTEPLFPSEESLLPKIADALSIYVEDSREKLSTFDDVFKKLSLFQNLLTGKLEPKIVSISRDKGIQIYRNEHSIPLESLSSGEKHEFVMFYKLIFETPANSVVLIDEPEISLHVLWQLEFIEDLKRIQNQVNFQVILATHSPQILQGLDKKYIIDLSEQSQ